MSRPTLHDHLVLRAEDYATTQRLARTAQTFSDAIGGGCRVFSMLTGLMAVAFGFASVIILLGGDSDGLGVLIGVGALAAATGVLYGVSVLLEKQNKPAWDAYEEAFRVQDDRFQASILADLKDALGVTVRSEDVPAEAQEAKHALATLADGSQEQVVLVFPAEDAPIMVSRMATLEPVPAG